MDFVGKRNKGLVQNLTIFFQLGNKNVVFSLLKRKVLTVKLSVSEVDVNVFS